MPAVLTIQFAGDAARTEVVERPEAAGHAVTREAGQMTVEDQWRNAIRLHVGPLRDPRLP